MNYYDEIKNKIIKSELYDRVKNYTVDRNKVKTYFEIGRLLHEAGKEYGKNIIKQYSDKLVAEVGAKYKVGTLYKIRKFYEIFSNEKLPPVGTILSWSHYKEFLAINDINEIKYYIKICEQNNLTKRELREKIKSQEYHRLPNKELTNASDIVPNPVLIKNNNEHDKFNEYVLKELILNNLDDFLSQLGFGFSYVGNEYKIKHNGRYNYIDLLLFNTEYNCYVVIELKVTELKKEHIGQIGVYMNYIDKNLKKDFQNSTIGIIICKKENKFVIEYCSDERIAVREYRVI